MNYPHPIIAREGWPFIVIAAAVAVLVHTMAGYAWAIFPWLIVLFMVQFFRDPPRKIPEDSTAVLSAADGRVVSLERVRDPYLERDVLKISVFLNVFNTHSALWIKTPSGRDVTCVQVAGFVARRILCYAKTGQTLARGERFGFIRFGSRVDIYLPTDAVVLASVGDKVYATESILAQLP